MAYGDIDLTPEVAAWLVHHRVLKEEHLTQPVKGETTVCVFDKAAQDLLFEGVAVAGLVEDLFKLLPHLDTVRAFEAGAILTPSASAKDTL